MDLNKRIVQFLDMHGVEFKLTNHEPVITSEEAAKVRGSNIAEGAKALLFWAYPTEQKSERYPIQIVINGDKKVSKEKLVELINVIKVKMLSADEVEQLSSVRPGAVPPFGNLFQQPTKVILAKTFLINEYMEFNVALHTQSVRMKTSDWIKIINPDILDISE